MELTFIHIPKNAGTSIVQLGFNNGYKWGRHLQPRKLATEINPDWHHPSEPWKTGCSGWHIPPRMFNHNIGYDIYFKNKQPFCVIRNPYDRIISEYMYCRTRSKWKNSHPDNINEFIKTLPQVKCKIHNNHDNHLLSQSEYTYVYNIETNIWEQQTNSNKQIEILNIENLQEEFDNLIKKYNHSITSKLLFKNKSSEGINVNDLTKESIDIINTLYHEDFINFGYIKR